MTFPEALRVLIAAAGRDCAGAGTGIRSLPSDAEKRRVRDAIVKVYPKAYGGREARDADLRNLGIWE
jgi:hypothetical protein